MTRLPERSTRLPSGKKDSIMSKPTKPRRRFRRLISRLKPQVLPIKLPKKVPVLFPTNKSILDLASNSKRLERDPRML